MKSNLVDIEATLHHRTEKAILISVDGTGHKKVWLPKSAIEWEHVRQYSSLVNVTLPEALAIDKELV